MSPKSIILLFISIHLSFANRNPCLQTRSLYGTTTKTYTKHYPFETHLSFNTTWIFDYTNSSFINIAIPYISSPNLKLSLNTNDKLHISYFIQSNNYKILSPNCHSIQLHNNNMQYHLPNSLTISITNTQSLNSIHITLTNSSSQYSLSYACKLKSQPFSTIHNKLHLHINHKNSLLFKNKPFTINSNGHCAFTQYTPIKQISRRQLLAFGTWQTGKTVMDRSDGNMAIGLYSDSIYIIGGIIYPQQLLHSNPPIINDLGERYNKLGVTNKGQFYSEYKDIVYMINSDGTTLSIFDLFQRQLILPWNNVIIKPFVGDAACIAAYEQYLYIIGGQGSGNGMQNVQVYNIDKSSWISVANTMNAQRQYLSCIVHTQDRMLYAIGGSDIKNNERINIDVIQSDNWKLFGELAIKTYYSRAVQYDNNIIIIGGQDGVYSGNILAISQTIDIIDTIVTTQKLVYSIRDTAAIVRNGILFAFGGSSGDQGAYVNKWQAIDLNIPTESPTQRPTRDTISPTNNPSKTPTKTPTNMPSITPSRNPTITPTTEPTLSPSFNPSNTPTNGPTKEPSISPTDNPSNIPTLRPSVSPITPGTPTRTPTQTTITPSVTPSISPSKIPSITPTISPSNNPSITPTKSPTNNPSISPSDNPTISPSNNPSVSPTKIPTNIPTITPTKVTTPSPTPPAPLTCNSYLLGDWNGIMINFLINLPYIGDMEIKGYVDNQSVTTLAVYNVFNSYNLVSNDDDNNGEIYMNRLNASLYQIRFDFNPNITGIFNISVICIEYIATITPTIQPTLPPTPNCLSLMVNVTDAIGFDDSNFNGLYTYIPGRLQFGRPIWEIPHDSDGQNVKYYDGNWIIHGIGNDILSHKANTFFPPHQDNTAQWKHSNVNGIFHVDIRCIDSYSPTFAPTTSPIIDDDNDDQGEDEFMIISRNNTDDYDGLISIIYVLQNVSRNEYEFISNYESNSALKYMSNIIETHYLHPLYLPLRKSFMINILKINRINISDNNHLLIFDNIYSYDKNNIYFRSEIVFEREYEFYLITLSKDTAWHKNVTKTFRNYFNNPILNFTVANITQILPKNEEIEISKSFKVTFSLLNIFLGICIIIGVLAYLYNKYSIYQKIFRPVDSSNWFAIIFYGLQIYDIVSDINLTTEMFLEHNNPSFIIWFCAYSSLAFLLIPYCMNIYYAITIPKLTANNICSRTYFSNQTNMSLFITLIIFSGGCYPSLDLISSGIFGLHIFESGLSSFELQQLSEIRVLGTVLTENIPNIIIQIIYSYSIGILSPNTILAFCTSFASICGSLIVYFIHKDKKGKVKNIDYYLEIRNKIGGDKLFENEKKHIERYKGIKIKLTKEMVDLYENIDISNFEIGFVTIRKDNFLIRIIQQLHEQDLFIHSMSANTKTTSSLTMTVNDINEYELLCYNLYKRNKREIQDKIYEHYYELDRNKFEIEYHILYPGSLELLQRSIDLIENNVDTIQQDIKEKVDSIANLNSAKIMKSDEALPEGITQTHYEFYDDRRQQFQKGYKLIKLEMELLTKKNGKNYKITSMQINRFIHILHQHKINPTVIEDVLNFAVESNTFHKQSRRNSDIDISHTDHVMDEEIELWAKGNV